MALPCPLPEMLSVGPLSSHRFSHRRDSAADKRNFRQERFILAPGLRGYQSTVTGTHGGRSMGLRLLTSWKLGHRKNRTISRIGLKPPMALPPNIHLQQPDSTALKIATNWAVCFST